MEAAAAGLDGDSTATRWVDRGFLGPSEHRQGIDQPTGGTWKATSVAMGGRSDAVAIVRAATWSVPANVTNAASSRNGGQAAYPEGHGTPHGKIVGAITILWIG